MYPDIFAFSNFDDISDPFVIFFLVFYLGMIIFQLLYITVSYVLQAIGLHTIAKRRGIHHPWLAWVPVGVNWLIGSISDQYQYVAKGRVRNRRKVLLGLSIPTLALAVGNMLLAIHCFTAAAMGVGDEGLILISVLTLGQSLVLSVLTIVLSVFQYIATYDLYASCVPKNAVLFLILHLLFGLGAIFTLVCCKKDEGMPPRRVQVPVAPWQPTSPPPAYQPPAADPVQFAADETEVQ